MNPRKQECFGLYLYGAGYFAREDQRAGILRGERTEASFCGECPARGGCEAHHNERMKETRAEAVDVFEGQVRQAERRRVPRRLVSVARMQSGDPDPYMAGALENYQRGVRDRAAADASS